MRYIHLESAAVWWLTFTKKCQIVLQERTPRHHLSWSRPDVLGVTPARFLCEIECKRSLSDFLADMEKAHIRYRDHYLKRFPKWFYYCVPEDLLEKVEPHCPEWAGLMYVQGHTAFVRRVAPANPESPKLSVKECCRMTKLLSYQVISQTTTISTLRERWTECDWGRDYDI